MPADHAIPACESAAPVPATWSRRRILVTGSAALGASVVAGWPQAAAWIDDSPSAAQRPPAVPRRARASAAVESAPSPSPAPAPAAAPKTAPSAGPRALVEQPPLVARSAWCEHAPAGNHRHMSGIERITIHHTGADTRGLGASDFQTVQRIEDYHRYQLGWACIGYHYLVGWDGTVYEGRPLDLQGAHVRWNNPGNIGIAVIGDCEHARPSRAQLLSTQWLVERYRAKFALHPGQVLGHRELVATTCPGKHLFAWLTAWRSSAAAQEV